jgi:DNA ligase-associated metallophosphoesterase
LEIELAGEKILLTEDKIIYWPQHESVFIADVHLGKTTHFRKSGIAVPVAMIKTEIDRIEKIISQFRPGRIFFLGDLFHSDLNHEWNIFNDFLESHADIEFILIKGNHDILNDKIYKLSRLIVKEEPFQLNNFVLSHHPLEEEKISDDKINLCGHIHPGISIKGKGRSHLRLACFYLEKNVLILPAFGRFTGLAMVNPKKGDSVFAVLNNSVRKMQ